MFYMLSERTGFTLDLRIAYYIDNIAQTMNEIAVEVHRDKKIIYPLYRCKTDAVVNPINSDDV